MLSVELLPPRRRAHEVAGVAMAGLRIFLCLLICAATAFVAGGALSELEQDLLPQRPGGFTSKGTEFFFAFMGNDILQRSPDQSAVLFVTNAEPRPVEVTVEVNSAFYVNNPNLNATAFPQTRVQTVQPNSSVTFSFPVAPGLPDEDIRVYRIDTVMDRNSGIRVSTDGGEVSVYGINNEFSSVDAFTVFPCQEYNTIVNRYEYIVMGAPVNTIRVPIRNNSILIVGCQSDTDVELIPPFQLLTIPGNVPTNLGGSRTPRPGEPLQITGLNPLTSLILNIVDDPTGTRIESTKPIAVFTGHQCANIPDGDTPSCDHVVQQVPPQLTWGTRFFTVPVVGRYSGDHYRVATTTDNTQFNVTCRTLANPVPTIQSFTIAFNDDTNSGFELFNTNIGTTSGNRDLRKDDLQWCCIESNNPVQVMQYAFGESTDMALKDNEIFGAPFMTIIPPVVQYLNDYVLPTQNVLSEIFSVGYTIAVPQSEFFNSPSQDGSSIEVDGVAVEPDEGWIELFCSSNEICGYAARVERAPSGIISVRHTNPSAAISAWVYGIAEAVSFAYTAGFKLDEVAYPILCINNVSVNETQGQAMISITRTGDLQSGGSRFFLTVVDGTATSPADYSVNYTVSETGGIFDDVNATTRELRMRAGIGVLTLTFSIAQDDTDENPEDFFLLLEGTRRAFVLCPVGRVTIIDLLPPAVEVGFAPVQYTVNEAGAFAVLTIIKRGTFIQNISVDFTTLPGTALAGDDYETTTQTLLFTPRQTIIRVSVPIVRDNTAEPTEQFFGDLSNPMGRVTIFQPTATVEITDDDPPVIIRCTERDYRVREDNGTVTVCLQKDVDTLEDLMLNVAAGNCDPPDALANQDYTPATNAVTFPATASMVCTSFGILDDDILEDPEIFCVDFEVQPLMFNVPVVEGANCRVTILDDESCCRASTCFEGTGCGGDSMPEATRKGDCCAGMGLSFTDAEQRCFECFSEASFTGGGNELFLAFFNNLFPGPFFSRAGVRLFVGAVGEEVGQDRVPFMVESSKDQLERRTGEGGTPTEVSLDIDIRLVGVEDRNEGVCVRSLEGQDLSVVAFGEEFTSADTFKVLPCVFLPNREYEYFVVSVQTTPPDPNLGVVREKSAFAVVASEDETTITLNLTQRIDISSASDLVGQIGSSAIEAGQPVTVTLDQLQSLYISSVPDLTGSRVVTNKPVSFIVGHECGNIPFDATFCDQMSEQIPPTATWGFNFLTAPIANRRGMDIFKVVSSRSSGSFRGSCFGEGGEVTQVVEISFEQAGRPEEFPVQFDEYCAFTSTVPVLLLQFSTGTAVDNITNADPFMVIVPPIEQYQSSYQLPTFLSQSTPGTNFLNIFVPASVNRSQVLLDGSQVTELLPGEWVEVLCDPESQAVCSLAQLEVTNVPHVLSHTDPNAAIGVIAYWLAFRAGHGYVGGMTQRPIALPIVTFESVDVSVFENEESYTVQLIVDGFVESGQDIEVFIKSRDGSAIAGEDYDPIDTSIAFEPVIGLQFRGTLTPDDVFPEETKSFEIFMTASPGVYLSPTTVITVTILNDDPPLPEVNISFAETQLTVREGEGIVQFRLLKADDLSVPGGRGIVRVMLTTADGSAFGAPFGSGDYQPLDVVIAFDVNDTEQIVSTTITDNERLESVESFTATIVALSGTFPVAVVMNATATVDIVDDDIVVVGFNPALYTVGEGRRTLSVAVQLLFGETDVDFSVIVTSSDMDAIGGEDFEAVDTTLTFGVQSPLTQAVVVTILNDNEVELSELFRLRLRMEESFISNSIRLIPDTADVLIQDNDRLVVGLDGSSEVMVEEGESVEVTVRVLEGELEEDTELLVGLSAVSRTALAELDFQEMINMQLVFSSDTSSRVVQIPTTEDETFEERETFVILLSLLSYPGVGSLARYVVNVTILDDDLPMLEFQCFQAANCTGNPLVTQTPEACCTTVGISFQLQGGVDICKPCILVGFSERVYSLRERERPHALTVTVVQGNSLPQSLSLAVTAVLLTASPSDFQLLTPEIALLSDSDPPRAEVRISLPQESLEENDDLSVESFGLLLNDELQLAPANVFFQMSLVNIQDTGQG